MSNLKRRHWWTKQPRVGDLVEVLAGPYAHKTGDLLQISDQGLATIFIDDCCRPVLPLDQLQRRGRGSSVKADLSPDLSAVQGQARSELAGHGNIQGLGGGSSSSG